MVARHGWHNLADKSRGVPFGRIVCNHAFLRNTNFQNTLRIKLRIINKKCVRCPCSQDYFGNRGNAERAKANRWWMEDTPDRQVLREQTKARAQREIRSEIKSQRAPIGVGRSKAGAIANGVMGALGTAMFAFGLAMSLVSAWKARLEEGGSVPLRGVHALQA